MKKNDSFKLLMLFLVLSIASQLPAQNNKVCGFWEGPHPSDTTRKFYVEIKEKQNKLEARGYWTHDGHYNSAFQIDSASYANKRIKFYVPEWGCTYSGTLIGKKISGGFSCSNEPFDSVRLIKRDAICIALTEAKKKCHDSSYTYQYYPPVPFQDGLLTDPIQTISDSLFYNSLVNEIIKGKYGRLNSILFATNNKLVGEDYFYDYDAQSVHQVESCTKSITSLLIGIAKDKGFIHDLNQPIWEIFKNYPLLKEGNYKKITIRHLLTMSAGFENKNNELFQSDNPIAFALNRKLVNEPGKVFDYDGGCTELLGAILKIKTGMYANEFADKYLFEPLKITNYTWGLLGQTLYPSMAGALSLLPRDFMKIGLLVLNKGQYKDQKIVSEEWIAESTSRKIGSNIDGDDYGYQWWCIKFQTNKNTYDVIWANGWGSQFIFIVPKLDMVLVTTGQNYEFDSWAIREGVEAKLYFLE